MRTQVAIVGAGPAGTLLSQLLDLAGIESIVLEARTREYVLGRIRAGVLEQASVDALIAAGAGERVRADGQIHSGVNLAFRNQLLRIDFAGLVGRTVTVYGQTEVQKDLYAARALRGGNLIFEAEDAAINGIEAGHPYVTFRLGAEEERLECDFVVGCDGSHGVSREVIPFSESHQRTYPFGWVGVLSETPPINEELVYANHPRGFALCSLRSPTLSRYYLQCSIADDIDQWPDDRFWTELERRLPPSISEGLVTGPSIEKSITPLRSVIHEPMSHGRLFLAGDAAHVVPPTGAKGLNLAISDVIYLSQALGAFYTRGEQKLLATYSATALSRVWQAVRFSWWLTNLTHRVADEAMAGRLQEAELDYLAGSVAARTAFAESYTGLPIA